ncbi:MAG TPA: SPASM domain-containing protein, partial [Lamprocystis sp. (in: g-proteobacteria)]|nr:SPASM domain-containing protein [Lamprocystis sp. (in: g-proteobacteria)]
TQDSYGRFRKGGDLALVLDNLRRMVAERQRTGATRPRLVWRFFPFAHNVHEIDDVMAAADRFGVDQVIIGDPFDVSSDDPAVRRVDCDKKGRYELRELPPAPEPPMQALVTRYPRVEALFEEGWSARSAGVSDERAHRDASPCLWLYYSVTVDARGRVMPCCISPTQKKHLVYGRIQDGVAGLTQLPDFRASRLALAQPAAYQAQRAARQDAPEPWCLSCRGRPPLTYSPPNAVRDLIALDPQGALNCAPALFWSLGKWS